MDQLTIRASAELIARVRTAASDKAKSVNAYVTSVLDAATNPALAGSEAAAVRERLRHAGLLADVIPPQLTPPTPTRVRRARAAAGKGTPLSELVAGGR